jgi:hypothetical protein
MIFVCGKRHTIPPTTTTDFAEDENNVACCKFSLDFWSLSFVAAADSVGWGHFRLPGGMPTKILVVF